jgi:ribosomal protein L19
MSIYDINVMDENKVNQSKGSYIQQRRTAAPWSTVNG